MSEAGVIPLKSGVQRPLARQDTIGVLDIGSTKMCCLIGRNRAGSGMELLGASYQLAEGLKAGEIVDVEAVEASILAVVHEAEQQAGDTLRDVVVGVTAGRPASRRTIVEQDLGGRAVTANDVMRALSGAEDRIREDGVECLHALPVEVTLDGGQPLKDPRGMIGKRLSVEAHVVQTASVPLHNLVAAVERCHLEVQGVVANAYAAGLAALSEEEMALGALVLDLGGGVTGAARFAAGKLQEVLSVPLGAHHVTQDLAFGLSIGRDQAERLKTLYGSALEHAGDSHERIEVPGIGDPTAPPSQIVTRAKLTEVIRPRVEEIFHILRYRLGDRMPPLAGCRLVLTGGGGQLE
ncbi:MAG: cell division protein FtsA, partial [Geminicoccaceae bacterium]